MHIDLPTLYAVTAFATTVSGLMLLFSWLQTTASPFRFAPTSAWDSWSWSRLAGLLPPTLQPAGAMA